MLGMRAIGDKVVLKKKERPDQGVITTGTEILCEVVEVGPGMPYGRGEYYSLTLERGDLVILPATVWEKAASFRLRKEDGRSETFRVVHEREVLVALTEGEIL
jgi:co-chaperonin GroES (HSP10)